MLEAKEIRSLIEIAGTQLKAMILLGVNAGFGNHDATLPIKAVDLKLAVRGDFRVRKLESNAAVTLWPETLVAVKAAIAVAPPPRMPRMPSWSSLRSTASGGPRTPQRTRSRPSSASYFKALKLHRPGLGFYALRHTFETIGGESRDQVAVNYLMGHAPPDSDMASVYRERISDERLKAVTDHVHKWLFGEDSEKAKTQEDTDSGGTATTAN